MRKCGEVLGEVCGGRCKVIDGRGVGGGEGSVGKCEVSVGKCGERCQMSVG